MNQHDAFRKLIVVIAIKKGKHLVIARSEMV